MVGPWVSPPPERIKINLLKKIPMPYTQLSQAIAQLNFPQDAKRWTVLITDHVAPALTASAVGVYNRFPLTQRIVSQS